MKKILAVLLVAASAASAQSQHYGNLNVYGYFDASVGTYSKPFSVVTSDITGQACSNAAAVTMDTTDKKLFACISGVQTVLTTATTTGNTGTANVTITINGGTKLSPDGNGNIDIALPKLVPGYNIQNVQGGSGDNQTVTQNVLGGLPDGSQPSVIPVTDIAAPVTYTSVTAATLPAASTTMPAQWHVWIVNGNAGAFTLTTQSAMTVNGTTSYAAGATVSIASGHWLHIWSYVNGGTANYVALGN